VIKEKFIMRATLLTLVFTVGTLPAGFAQVPASTTTEHSEEHAATTVNPDGTAVHHAATTHEKTDSTVNPDGSSSTVKSKSTTSKTRVRGDAPVAPPVVDSSTVHSEHHESSTTTSTNPNP
jgi:hypothetical protein